MARAKSSSSGVSASTATIGFEAKLWLTADKLRNISLRKLCAVGVAPLGDN